MARWLDLEAALECLLDRAAVRDREQPLALVGRERTAQLDLSFAAPNADRLRLAVLTVGGIGPHVAQSDNHVVQWPSLPHRVHAERHRRARAEGTEKVIVGSRTRVRAAGLRRF